MGDSSKKSKRRMSMAEKSTISSGRRKHAKEGISKVEQSKMEGSPKTLSPEADVTMGEHTVIGSPKKSRSDSFATKTPSKSDRTKSGKITRSMSSTAPTSSPTRKICCCEDCCGTCCVSASMSRQSQDAAEGSWRPGSLRESIRSGQYGASLRGLEDPLNRKFSWSIKPVTDGVQLYTSRTGAIFTDDIPPSSTSASTTASSRTAPYSRSGSTLPQSSMSSPRGRRYTTSDDQSYMEASMVKSTVPFKRLSSPLRNRPGLTPATITPVYDEGEGTLITSSPTTITIDGDQAEVNITTRIPIAALLNKTGSSVQSIPQDVTEAYSAPTAALVSPKKSMKSTQTTRPEEYSARSAPSERTERTSPSQSKMSTPGSTKSKTSAPPPSEPAAEDEVPPEGSKSDSEVTIKIRVIYRNSKGSETSLTSFVRARLNPEEKGKADEEAPTRTKAGTEAKPRSRKDQVSKAEGKVSKEPKSKPGQSSAKEAKQRSDMSVPSDKVKELKGTNEKTDLRKEEPQKKEKETRERSPEQKSPAVEGKPETVASKSKLEPGVSRGKDTLQERRPSTERKLVSPGRISLKGDHLADAEADQPGLPLPPVHEPGAEDRERSAESLVIDEMEVLTKELSKKIHILKEERKKHKKH